ncbi:MAG: hypothetical protein Q8M65_09855, partial [Rhodoglobus sp.]|nr:hypothetical protein [Rhodoglobus sp.]
TGARSGRPYSTAVWFCKNLDADRSEISLTPASVSYSAATSAANDLHRSMKICRWSASETCRSPWRVTRK